jgi:hypothetical protein
MLRITCIVICERLNFGDFNSHLFRCTTQLIVGFDNQRFERCAILS